MAAATKSWSLVRSNGACPTARSGHSAVVAKENLYIFGGCGHPIATAAAATTAGATTTSRGNAAATGGVQAAGAAAAGDDSDDTMPVCLGDLHVYDLARQSWSEVSRTPARHSRGGRLELDAGEGIRPAERTCAAMCASEDETSLFLSGGAGDDPDDLRADLLEFDVRRRIWRLLFDGGSSGSSVSEGACRRIGHAMVHDAARNRLVVFGGSTGFHYFDDTHAFDLSTRTWTRLTTTGDRPSPRYKHEAFIDGDWMYVIGGGSYEPEGPHLDVFRLHLAPSPGCASTKARYALEWERLHPTGTPPRCRAAHGLAWDRVGRAAYIWGGFTTRMELDTTFCALRLPPAPANAPPLDDKCHVASPLQSLPSPGGGSVATAPASSWSAATPCAQNAVSHSRAASVDGGDFLARYAVAAAGGDNRDRATDRVRYAVRQALTASVLAAVGNNKSGGGGNMDESPAVSTTSDISTAVVPIDDVVDAPWQHQQQQQLLSLRNQSPARVEPTRNPNGRGYHDRERWRCRGQHLWRPAGEHGHSAGLQLQQRQQQSRRRSSRGGAGRRRTWGQGWTSGRLQGLWRGGAIIAAPAAPAFPAGQGSNTASPSPLPSPPPPPVVSAVAPAAAIAPIRNPRDSGDPQQRLPTIPPATTMSRGQHVHTTSEEELAWVSLPSGSVGDAAPDRAPAGRSFHCTFFHAGACYITGGSDGARKFGDMWRFAARETPPTLTTLAARAVVLVERAAAAAVTKDKMNKKRDAVGQPFELRQVGDGAGDDNGNAVGGGGSQLALLPAELRTAVETINMQAKVIF